jgi:hypothetical protein
MENAHILPGKWCLYVHFASNATNYKLSYAHIMDVDSCEDWAQMMNFVPSCHVLVSQKECLQVYGKTVYSFSFFREHVRPEWEDEANKNGTTLSMRLKLTKSEIQELWKELTCDCARGAMEQIVLGVQLIKKYGCVKLDVWVSASRDDVEHLQARLNRFGKAWKFDLHAIPRK